MKYILLTLLSFILLISCRRGYKVENNRVYYEFWNEGTGQNKVLLDKADAKTFKEITFDCESNMIFGKDKNNLYINGEIIDDIDPQTFNCVGNYIFRDKNAAFFFGSYSDINKCRIEGIDQKKIKLLDYPWAKAGDFLIHRNNTIKISDIKDFVPIDEDWGKTKKNIINEDLILFGADVKTFQVISSFEGKDKNFTYEFGVIREEDFKKTKINTFDFTYRTNCLTKPVAFTDVYKHLVNYKKDKNKPIKVVEHLKQLGFKILDTTYVDWAGESKLIRVVLRKGKCNCVVEKLYRYDYGKPAETVNHFKVTERIYRLPK